MEVNKKMALKDWKKSEKYVSFTEWENQSKEGKISVSNKEGSFLMKRKEKTGFLVSAWTNNGISNNKRKRFKTKAQALKFAKAYMRKH